MKFKKWFENRVSVVSEMHAQLLKTDDIELLHQYRVNLRRLYAYSEVYAKEINKHSSKELSKLLKKLLKSTALLRDIDLFLIDIESIGCCHFTKDRLRTVLKLKRDNTFKIYMQTIGSAEYKSNLELLMMMTKEREFFVYKIQNIDKHKIISDVEKSRYEELARVDMQTPSHELHKLRKEFKKFRYALDIYEHCFFDNRDFDFDFAKLKRLQDLFGEIQDNFVRLELIRSIKEELTEGDFLELQDYYELKLFDSKQLLFENFDIL
ncbi:CHAD domain-containing protein [Sulfurimonas sp.]|uniref:CHAD domain-containing protein n=1 Tax=Sulfurimonas sp. TaxID=2022749 RepID=UPI0035681030